LAVALIDLLVLRPFDVAHDQEGRAIGQPHGIGCAVGETRYLARVSSRDREQPHLRPAFPRRDERERLAVGRPARLAVRARPTREGPRAAGRDLDDPDARDVPVVLERRSRDRVGDPLAVRRQLRIAYGLERDVVFERDGALLGGNDGWHVGKLECEYDSENQGPSTIT